MRTGLHQRCLLQAQHTGAAHIEHSNNISYFMRHRVAPH